MPTGVIVNSMAVVTGGSVGAVIGNKIPPKMKSGLTQIFGLCSMGMGINSIILMKYMPAVIFSVVVGTAVGFALKLNERIHHGAVMMEKPVERLFKKPLSGMSEEEYISVLVAVLVLFCASGTGIYGSLDAGMSGDHTILFSKSILDFFTAMIFACNLGMVVPFIAIPQSLIFMGIFAAARFIYPLTTMEMLNDFKACGGFLLVATGFRIAKICEFSIADMIPAMVLVMPASWLWATYIIPIL